MNQVHVGLQEREYPNIIRLKKIEAEMHTAINEYKYLQDTLTAELNHEVADREINTYDGRSTVGYLRQIMQEQINVLKMLVEEARPILANILAKGELNQDIVSVKQKDLNEINSNLQVESDKLRALEIEVNTIERENDIASKQQTSYMLQSFFLSLLAIVIAGLTINAVMNPKGNFIETAILVIIVALVVYYLYQKYV